MGNNSQHLSNDASAKEISEWLENHTDQHIEAAKKQAKKKTNESARREVRRNIEDIKEKSALKKLLGDDYDLLDS